jgi:cystathionine gamma-synthase
MLCSSLTKLFSGAGDVMAGSMVLNSSGRRYEQLRAELQNLQLPQLSYSDADILERNSRDFRLRSKRISKSHSVI